MASSEGGGPSVYIHTHMPRDGDPPAGFTCTRATADDLTRHTSSYLGTYAVRARAICFYIPAPASPSIYIFIPPKNI